MKDRISANPGRVLIVPEDGRGTFYATMALADTPQQEGTELNKANLLSDSTVSSMRMPTSPEPTVDLALKLLSGRVDRKAESSDNRYDPVIGSYTGDEAATRTVSLGFRPAALFVFSDNGTPFYHDGSYPYYLGGFVTSQNPTNETYSEGVETLALTIGGFRINNKSVSGSFQNEAVFLNSSGEVYNYIAFREV